MSNYKVELDQIRDLMYRAVNKLPIDSRSIEKNIYYDTRYNDTDYSLKVNSKTSDFFIYYSTSPQSGAVKAFINDDNTIEVYNFPKKAKEGTLVFKEQFKGNVNQFARDCLQTDDLTLIIPGEEIKGEDKN